MNNASSRERGYPTSRTRRALVTFSAVMMAAALAACGGGGGGSVVPSGNAVPGQVGTVSGPAQAANPVGTLQPSPSVSATPSLIYTQGTIHSTSSNGFNMQTGSPHGYINVITSASTTFTGAKPFVGEFVVVTANGSWLTELQAVTVAQEQQLAANTPSPPPTPTPTPTPMPTAVPPAHIQTWAFDEYWAEGANAPSSAVASYLTYAEGGGGNAKARLDCSGSPKPCSSVFYFDPNFQYSSANCPMQPDATFIAAGDETWFVHEAGYTDAAHRVTGSYTQNCKGAQVTVPVYLSNQNSPAVTAWWSTWLQSVGDNWDYYFMDDTSTTVLSQTYGPGGGFCQDASPNHWCSTTQEYPTDASVAQAHVTFASNFYHKNGSPDQFFFNGVGFSGQTPQNLQLITMGPQNFVGAVCENCIVNAGTLRPTMYAPVLNAMAQLDATPHGAFIELNTGYSPAGSAAQVTQRLVTTAMAWLGYSEGHTVVFPNLEDNTQNLAAWPEDMLYPAYPVQSMTNGASDIQVTSGVYRREFAACYNNRTAIGQCAAIVNSTPSTITVSSTWLAQTYGHAVTLNGGDILSGGAVSLTATPFSANVTTIAPGAAILLVQ